MTATARELSESMSENMSLKSPQILFRLFTHSHPAGTRPSARSYRGLQSGLSEEKVKTQGELERQLQGSSSFFGGSELTS